MAFFVVALVDAARMAIRKRGHLLKTLLSHRDSPMTTVGVLAVLGSLLLVNIIPAAAHTAIAWTLFAFCLILLAVRLVRS